MHRMHRMMVFGLAACLVWMAAAVKTARCDEIAELTEYVAELVEVDPETLVRCNTCAFPRGCYRFKLFYENSVAEDFNEFGWTKWPYYCLEEAEPVEVKVGQPVQEVGKQSDMPYPPPVCACGGFNKIIPGAADPGDIFYRYIWSLWAPAFNSPPMRNLHQGGYYTSLKHFNWDHMKHLEVFCFMDPADTEARPTKSWIFCWWDNCNRPGHFFDSMILRADLLPIEICPQVEEIP